jgi:hypothetical protein
LLSALITIFLGAMLAGCRRQVSDDITSQHLRSIAGKNATDCGHVGLHQSTTAASDCALATWKADRPFLVSYDVQGIDSKLVFGLASGGAGDVFSVKYDTMGWQADELHAGMKVLDSNHILVVHCPPPVKLFISSAGYLVCHD